jgi:signal transduction histidine kinase
VRIRRTLRTRLALLYAGPFLVSGGIVLAFVMSQASDTTPAGVSMPPALADRPDHYLRSLFLASATGMAMMAVLALVLGWMVAGRFVRPLRAITATARSISATNLHRRLNPVGRDDEFKDLAETLDDLFARLEAAFESQRRFVANASHELRTPLTAERALLQVALTDPAATAETLRAACEEVLALGASQERLIGSLLTLASGEQGIERPEPFDLADVTERTVRSRREEAARRGIELRTLLEPALVAGDPNLAESLVANLIDNALRYNVADGWVAVVTSILGDRAILAIANTGPLVPHEELDRLFQPFQQLGTQRTRHNDGHGLGLAIVRAIAKAHHAHLTPRARAEGGMDVEVSFRATPFTPTPR